MTHFTKSALEETAFEWLKDMGYTIVFGNDIASEGTLASLCDSPLPRLMKGEARVKDVEE